MRRRRTEVWKRPILYVPPLVNKYYLLDLQPKSSLIRWLVEQGHTVFVISWVNPGPELADKGLADYIRQGPIEALDAIEKATGEREVDLFGFCMGGTLVAIALGDAGGEGRGRPDRLGDHDRHDVRFLASRPVGDLLRARATAGDGAPSAPQGLHGRRRTCRPCSARCAPTI